MKRWIVWMAAAAAQAQTFEAPLNIKGTFSSGYYNTYTRGEADQTVRFVPVGSKFDIDGFLLSPDLMNFSAQPEVNLGPQASEAGFQGGNGVRLRLMFLRKRMFPFSFRYSNVQVEDIYFGSLSQVSAYSMKNRNKELGLTWDLHPAGLPSTTIDWGTGSVNSQSGVAMIPDYQSHMRHLNADSRYLRWGWHFQGFAHSQKQETDLFAPLGTGLYTSSLHQSVKQYQASASHSLFSDSEAHFMGGSQSTASILYDLPIDLATRFASANLRLFQKRRWKSSLHAGYSSNLSSQVLAQVLAGASGLGPGAIAPDPGIVAVLQRQIANVRVNGITTVDLSHGWGLYGNVDRSAVIDPNPQSGLSASYLSTSSGITYSGKFGWGRLAGQYGRDLGRGSVTGQSGTITGQNYMVNAQHGAPDKLLFEFAVHGTSQNVENAVPIASRSFSTEASIAAAVPGNLRARIGGGWQWGTFQNAGTEFRSEGYTARAGIEHRRVQVQASLSNSLGNSLPIYNQLFGGNMLGNAYLLPLRIIPSDFRALNFTVHANPIRKLEISAMWTHSRQHLDRALNNDFELLNVHLTYHYRRLQIESGYIRSSQIFFYYPETRRGRFYVRVSRSGRIL